MSTSISSARAGNSKSDRPAEIPSPLDLQAVLRELRSALVERRIEDGMECLRGNASRFRSLEPDHPNAGMLVGYLAQWVDIGFDRVALIKDVLLRFTKPARAALSLSEYLWVRMADAFICMEEEEADAAIAHLDFIISMAGEFHQEELLAVAQFWKARCLRKKGDYDEALTHAVEGERMARALNLPKMAAVMRQLESWLLFQKGRFKEAFAALQQSESVLCETDDHVNLGNIYSSYGRIARRESRYEQAIQSFNRAIAEYRECDPEHRNLARTLTNIANVKRYVGLQLRHKIDADTERRRRAGTGATAKPSGRSAHLRERLTELRAEAFAHLEESARIYRNYPTHHGLGNVHLNFGYLHLDQGDFDRATESAAESFRLAQAKSDFILMVRARLLVCMIENTKLEEEIAEGANPGGHARHALEAAHDAVEMAKHTQSRRLVATAHVWQGLTESNAFLNDLEAAQHSYDLATAALKDEAPGNLSSDLQTLKSRIFGSGNVDPLLRAWTQGLVGTKPFQQIVDEFADIVIPKVWEREGRKVSRVAERLSMSPKKVRRILQRSVRRSARTK
jgi:tetratricopeptide (TPR) repeat protein